VSSAVSQVVTGEAVALDLRPARLPSRILAGLVDLAIQFVGFLGLGILAAGLSVQLDSAAVAAVSLMLTVVVLVVYPLFFETLWRGRTPGKAALGLRVVRDDGGPIGFREALVRALTGAFLERPGITIFVAAVVSQLLNGSGKRIGDIFAGTIVLRERVPVRGGVVMAMPASLAGWAATLDLSGLPDDLALSARAFLSRASELTPGAREDLGNRLVAAVAGCVWPSPPPGTPGWAFLAAVLAERRRRDAAGLPPGAAADPGAGAAAQPALPVPPGPTGEPRSQPPVSGPFAPPA
jgi:uncharacterized RDD family membrane protein YckC